MNTDTMLTRPQLAGVYPVSDAVTLIHATRPAPTHGYQEQRGRLEAVSGRHIYRWAKEGLAGDYLEGLRGREVALTFRDLVSLRLISVFRAYGIRSKEIRLAHRALQAKRGWTHPFAMEPVWVSGLHVYIREDNIPIQVARWQPALDFVELFVGPVHQMVFGEDQQALIWEPEDGIVLNPKISFGEPCLKNTRIATQTLWALHAAGDSSERIAEAYGLSLQQVEVALAWERRIGYNGTS